MNVDEALLDALRRAAGPDAVTSHAPVAIDDCAFEHSLRPPDGEALARSLAVLTERRVGVVVRGGGTRLDLGNPPRGAALLLDTRGLAGIEVLERGEGVLRAGAGTPLALLREKTAAEGWELPLDPPGAETTLGGVVASAAFGPRALAYGTPRDSVLGLDVVLASGERTRCGGRVVKNVTGYDLCKLYTGSCGALGVIEAVWLRLRPVPEATAQLEAGSRDLDSAVRDALEAARREVTRVASLHVPIQGDAPDARSVIELAGDAPAVEETRATLVAGLGARDADASALDDCRARQAAGEIVVRVTSLASRLAGAVRALHDTGAELLVQPGLSVVFASFPEARADAFARATEVARAAGGSARLERAPAALKRDCDVFGDVGDALPLERALKQRFDPAGILNPGRSAGRP